ncbi:MAG: aminotransferase class V-fold PLP-dependent enzyme [Actinomycetota bacterium]
MDIASVREQWDPEVVYLNTATYGLPPQVAWDALQEAIEGWRAGRTSFRVWDESVTGARAAFARLVGTDIHNVAIGSTVSAFAGLVAASLPEGSIVLVPDVEFTSNLFPWMVHADRKIEVRLVDGRDLLDAIDESITLVAISSVQSATGEVAPIDEIARAAHRCGTQVFVDATQSCGWLPIDASNVDFLACAAYKWLLSPRGTAFMTVGPERLDLVRPAAAGWYAGASVHDSYYGPPLRLAGSARRLDISPAWFSWVGTQPALELLESVGIDRIHEHNVGLANRFRAGMELPDGDSAIVSLDLEGAAERLESAGIVASVRGGRLRASFHLYNTPADVDAALKALAR